MKTALKLTITFALLFSIVGLLFVSLAEANPFWGIQAIDPPPGAIPAEITILNPKTNTTYAGGSLNVAGIVAKPEGDYTAKSALFTVEYFLNGSSYLEQRYDFSTSDGSTTLYRSEVDFSAVLSDVGSGSHELVVQVLCVIWVETRTWFEIRSTSTVFFTVDATPPVISELSVENKTYNEFDLPLNFTMDEPTSWMGYSLDDEAIVTLSGNSTLTLKEGGHSIVFYANDTFGNMGASPTISFTIAEPFPTTLVLASAIPVLVCVFAVFLVWMRKLKH